MRCANADILNAADLELKPRISRLRKRLISGVLALFVLGLVPGGLVSSFSSGEVVGLASHGVAMAAEDPPPSSLRGNGGDAPEQPVPIIDDEPEPDPAQSEQGGQAGQSGLSEDGSIGIRANLSGSSITSSPVGTPTGTPPGRQEGTQNRQESTPAQTAPVQSANPDRPTPRTTINLPTTSRPTGLKLFGTVEFKGPIKNLPQWLSVLQRNKENPIFDVKKKLGSVVWGDLKSKLEAQSPKEKLQTVNRFWNQWPYRQDPDVYKKQDYWAIPAEFLKNSGDCEDYAISKYFTLKEVGVPANQMRIVVLMETIRNIAHAVLVVYMDNDAFVLDNLSNNVLSHSRYRNYAPQFSVNEEFRWAHLQPKK